jgi:hypothetical protein
VKKAIFIAGLTAILFHHVNAQVTGTRPITMDEYVKAKAFVVKDLDKDTYVKAGTDYVLDRYEMRKPYFITGDDGLKKRIDLYKLIAKDGMQELGTQIFYTNEKGKQFVAIQPNFNADSKVWERYFEDIHAIDKVETNFVLKLSYILSREMSFQLYKSMNQGKDLKEESGTYGTDICFPGTQKVAMADGTVRLLSEIRAGDKVTTVDPVSKTPVASVVHKLIVHEAKNYAITSLLAVRATERLTKHAVEISLYAKVIEATPNHPMMTSHEVRKRIGDIEVGEKILCAETGSNKFEQYTVINTREKAGGSQQVFNMELAGGTTAVINNVMVLQK